VFCPDELPDLTILKPALDDPGLSSANHSIPLPLLFDEKNDLP
jgi:hypothetical protein